MKRIAVAVLVFASVAFAQDKKPMAPAAPAAPAAAAPTTATEPGSNMTCGQWAASKAPLPAKLGELMTAIADNLEFHAKWTGTKDKAAKAEHDMLMKMAKDHRAIGKMSTDISNGMTKAKDMAQATHDPKTMDGAKMAEMQLKQIKLQREMAQMMMKDADEAEKMLSSMKAGAGSK